MFIMGILATIRWVFTIEQDLDQLISAIPVNSLLQNTSEVIEEAQSFLVMKRAVKKEVGSAFNCTTKAFTAWGQSYAEQMVIQLGSAQSQLSVNRVTKFATQAKYFIFRWLEPENKILFEVVKVFVPSLKWKVIPFRTYFWEERVGDQDLCFFAISDRKTCKNWSRADGKLYDMSKARGSLLKI